jgi:hypothetical protein
MTKTALPIAVLLFGVSLAGCAQERAPAASSGASSTTQPMTTMPSSAQPMGTLGSGTSLAPVDPSTQQTIRNRLAEDGYSEVSNLQRDLGGYSATAVKEGKVVQVMIDADGKVTRVR